MTLNTRYRLGGMLVALSLGLASVHGAQAQSAGTGVITGEVDRCVSGTETPVPGANVGVLGSDAALGRTDTAGLFTLILAPASTPFRPPPTMEPSRVGNTCRLKPTLHSTLAYSNWPVGVLAPTTRRQPPQPSQPPRLSRRLSPRPRRPPRRFRRAQRPCPRSQRRPRRRCLTRISNLRISHRLISRRPPTISRQTRPPTEARS